MDKDALRKQYLGKRTALPKEVHRKKSDAIARLFFSNISLNNFKSLHTFLPIEKNGEVDTHIIIRGVREKHPLLVLLVPKIRDSDLVHYVLTDKTAITPGPYSVPEPHRAEPFGDQQIDAVLVPLLIFDQAGHRIGYGKGYYDRFLANYPNALKIGLSMFPPIDQIPDVSATDVPMDMAITPDEVFRFN